MLAVIVQLFHLAKPLEHKAKLVFVNLALSDLTLEEGLAFRALHLYPYAVIDITVHFSL